jgi:hypothetical protein
MSKFTLRCRLLFVIVNIFERGNPRPQSVRGLAVECAERSQLKSILKTKAAIVSVFALLNGFAGCGFLRSDLTYFAGVAGTIFCKFCKIFSVFLQDSQAKLKREPGQEAGSPL